MFTTTYPLPARTVALAAFLILGCEGPRHPVEPSPPIAHETGALEIAVSTTGNTFDLDADGYSLSVDAAQSSIVTDNSVVTLTDVPAGTHTIQLDGLAPNCAFIGTREHSVVVTDGGKAQTAFAIKCAPSSVQIPGNIAFVYGVDSAADIYVAKSDGGSIRQLTNTPGFDGDPAWSHDGGKIAFTSTRDGNKEIYVMNADGTNQVRLTNSPGEDMQPAWSPDGTKIAFVSEYYGESYDKIFVMDADGTNVRRVSSGSPGNDTGPAWSPDGTRIAFARDCCDLGLGIWIMNADGSRVKQRTSGYREATEPAWSPDGKTIAFNKTLYYTTDIYLVTADGSDPPMQLTSGIPYVSHPTWSPDGKSLAFGVSTYNGCFSTDGGYCIRFIQVIHFEVTAPYVPELPLGSLSYSPAWGR